MNNKEIDMYHKACEKLLTLYNKDQLCKILKISMSTLRSLLNGYRHFTIEHALTLYIHSKGAIKAHEICPNIPQLKKIKLI